MVAEKIRQITKAQARKGWLWSRRNPVTVALLVAAVFTYGMLMDTRDDQQITQQIVERSPCTADPAGRECQVLRNQIERARPIRETCIPFRRVGYRCPIGSARRSAADRPDPGVSSPAPSPVGPEPTGSSDPVPDSDGDFPAKPDTPVPAPPTSPTPPDPVDPSIEPTPTPPPSRPLIDLTPVTDTVCDLTRPIAALC